MESEGISLGNLHHLQKLQHHSISYLHFLFSLLADTINSMNSAKITNYFWQNEAQEQPRPVVIFQHSTNSKGMSNTQEGCRFKMAAPRSAAKGSVYTSAYAHRYVLKT